MRSKLIKSKPNQKNIYNVPREPNDYLIISKSSLEHQLENNHIYNVASVRYFSKFINRNKKIFISRYYICKNFDFDLLKDYRMANSKKTFCFPSETFIDNIMKDKYDKDPIIPNLNFDYNKNLFCHKCKITCYTNNSMIDHLRDCEIYIYTLFGEEIPKQFTKNTSNITNNVTINNNVTVNNTNYIGFRRSGNELLNLLDDQQKLKILRSMNKVNDLIDLQWTYPHLQNIRVFNKNLYSGSGCEIFDPNKKEFSTAITKECIRYLITDRLDDIDYMAYDTNDTDLIERNNRYDNNIRSNDKRMTSLMHKTVNQLYCLTKEKK